MLQRNTERNFHCEKLNYITSSYLGLFSNSRLDPKISPENTGFQVLVLIKIQTDCSDNVDCSWLNPGARGEHLTSQPSRAA